MAVLLQLSGCLAAAAALLLCGQSSARCPSVPSASCPAGESARWRRIDGSCNNPKDPTRGKANTPLVRILQPKYADGVHAPRRSVSGRPLPSPRLLVTKLLPDRDAPSTFTNQMVMNWAQLLSHDVSRVQAPIAQAHTPCCQFSSPTDSCAPIEVREDDPFFGQFGVKCLGLNRSASAPCHQAHHEQNNLVTHYLDASFVYGSDTKTMFRIRSMKGGLLKSTIIEGEDFLPNLQAGDGRVTITPMIAAMQTLWMREHNRVAGALGQLNRHWKDERIFQEARRIIVALWQLITYRDWLQWLIGTDTVEKQKLLPVDSGFSTDYSPIVDPSTANDFTTAAYRSFHSMVPNTIWFGGADEKNKPHEEVLLNEASASVIQSPERFRQVVEGMVYQPRQQEDHFMAGEITNKLFRGGSPFGTDLSSVDIMRGREHGLPQYNEYRARCNLTRATKWEDFGDTISAKNIQALRSVYEHLDDVDYLVGGLMESRKKPSALASVTSPVFQCIIVDQFRRWKIGDRFFFDRKGRTPGFTEAQLKEIRRQTWSRIICDNTRGMSKILQDAFLLEGVLGNREVQCADLAFMRFDPWKEDSTTA